MTAEEKRIADWENEKRAVTLSNKQWSRLTTYLLMSTNYRQGEAKAWAELANEKEEDGSYKFKNAESNAKFWEEMIEVIENVRKEIDGI